MMYKAEVQVVNDDKWYSNALTFDTIADAVAYAKDLHARWTLTRDWRIVTEQGEVVGKK